MSQHLFRFRPAYAVLDKFQELESQHIYFTPPRDLNDPLEGFKDIYWSGDDIVWGNFLRHYLLCLMQTITIFLSSGDQFALDKCSSVIFQTDDDLPMAPVREIYSAICEAFLGHKAPQVLISNLSSRATPVRRDELAFHLRFLHTLALTIISEKLGAHNAGFLTPTGDLESKLQSLTECLESVLTAHSKVPSEQSDELFRIGRFVTAQLNIIHEYNEKIPVDRQSWLFVARDFPDYYVDEMEKLIYPAWNSASFVQNPKDASMWGAYADGHKGVCLKFRVTERPNSNTFLELYRPTGWSGVGDKSITNYSYVPHEFHKIRYEAGFPEIDFFQSLSRVTMPKLKFWYTTRDGQRSKVADKVLGADEEWRQDYLRRYYSSFCLKMPEWAHEEEYRLILYTDMFEFDTVESRRLKYKFSDLMGIIFGIRTSTSDKMRILRIIEQKCRAEKRDEFEFAQAHYSTRTKAIEIAPLSLLRLK